MKEGNVFAKQKPANAKHLPSYIYERLQDVDDFVRFKINFANRYIKKQPY